MTGGYDCLLRVWRLDVDDVNGQLLQEFEGHNSFINTICFDSEGKTFTRLDLLIIVAPVTSFALKVCMCACVSYNGFL